MPTVHELIAASDRQIRRVKLRARREMVHLRELERRHSDTEQARGSLEFLLGELAFLQRYRSSLYQGTFALGRQSLRAIPDRHH
jgi:hypothetical protein